MFRWIRKYHKNLMALVGIQFLIWSVSGLYMVTMDIHFIHGETLVKQTATELDKQKIKLSPDEIYQRFPDASRITVQPFMDDVVYRFYTHQQPVGWRVINASNGELYPLFSQDDAVAIASHRYAHLAPVSTVRLIEYPADLPPEVSPRHLPVWQVRFKGLAAPTFYISQQSGRLVTKRHDFWRLFDWMWRFHIMDYDDGENVSNSFLTGVALLACLAAILGLLLTWYRVFRTKTEEAEHDPVV